jgi:hypothetical protein
VGADAEPPAGGDLVSHQRQQRRDDRRRPGAPLAQQGGGEEVDGRLAPTRALDGQHARAVGHQAAHGLELVGTKGAVRPRQLAEQRGATASRVNVGIEPTLGPRPEISPPIGSPLLRRRPGQATASRVATTRLAGIAHAWTLTRVALDLGSDDAGFGLGRAVLIIDEAGMASTREAALVLEHAGLGGVKVIAIGDSGQLSSVRAGGWLGSLTRRLGSYELRDVICQRGARERQLLARVRRGDAVDYIAGKSHRGQLQIFTGGAQAAVAGERAAIAAWREHQARCRWGQAVLITRDNARRARLNALVRAELARDGRLGEAIQVDGTEFAVGDRVIARRNDRLRALDNGTRGTVVAVDPHEKELIVQTDAAARRALDAGYVAEHLQHAYALTAHTIQGGTVEWAGVVGAPRDFTRNWSYTALSRARDATELFLIDTPTERALERAELAPGEARELTDQRPLLERLAAVMRGRDDEDLALDRLDGTRAPARVAPMPDTGLPAESELARLSVADLRDELVRLRARVGIYTDPPGDQLQSLRRARADAERTANAAKERIAELEQRRGLLRRRPADPGALTFERQRLEHAERQAAAAADRERQLAPNTPAPAEHQVLRERAAELEAQLSLRRKEHLRTVLEHPAPYLQAALDSLRDEPRARRTWQQAAQRIEAYRFDHNVTDIHEALGPPPEITARSRWQRAQQDLLRAQRELHRSIARGIGRQL